MNIHGKLEFGNDALDFEVLLCVRVVEKFPVSTLLAAKINGVLLRLDQDDHFSFEASASPSIILSTRVRQKNFTRNSNVNS